MDDLRRIFRQALPGRIASLESARAALAGSDAAMADGTAAIRRIAHTLRGSGGTYGFPEITAAAAAVEEAHPSELTGRLDELVTLLEAAAADAGPARPQQADGHAAAAGGMRILIVDDDPEVRLLAGFLLRQVGHEVTEAAHAAAAVAACQSGSPDVVLMDLILGEEDGIAAAGQVIAACAQRPRLVFLTGAARDDQLARLEGAAPAGIIRKPFDPATFEANLRSLVEGAR